MKKLPTQTTSNGHRRQHGEERRLLPVYKFRSEICKVVKENEAVLVIAETVSNFFRNEYVNKAVYFDHLLLFCVHIFPIGHYIL